MAIRTQIRLITFATALLALTACGKRGEPKPPPPIIPQAVSDLQATQRGESVILSWTYPSLTTAGRSLGSIRSIVVYRYSEILPAELAGKGVTAPDPRSKPVPVALFESVPQIMPRQFAVLREEVARLETSELPERTEGTRLIYEESVPFESEGGLPIRYTYAVVTEGPQKQSALSNLATIVPIEPPPPPVDPSVRADAAGVHLRWSAPSSDGAAIIGYNIYRFPAGGPIERLGTPIHPVPVEETSYSDTPPYGEWRYTITAIASIEPLIQSRPELLLRAEFRDLAPPPVPSELEVLRGVGEIRLVWSPVEAPDLAGFHVYRVDGKRRTRLTTEPITQPIFDDTGVRGGERLSWEVTSVDQIGNESAPVSSGMVDVPR